MIDQPLSATSPSKGSMLADFLFFTNPEKER